MMIVCALKFEDEYGYSKYLRRRFTFFDTLRNFSEKSLDSLLSDSLYGLLFKDFYDSGDFEQLKNSDSIMRKDAESYEQVARAICSKIELNMMKGDLMTPCFNKLKTQEWP